MELGPIQKEWVETLKKHPERQVEETLGERDKSGRVKACCLGQFLLCKMKKERKKLPVGDILDGGEYDTVLGESYKALGLRNEEGALSEDIEDDDGIYMSLADMNDKGYTWPEIADFVENNPEKVFTEPV